MKQITKFSVLGLFLMFFLFPGSSLGGEVGVTDTTVLVGCSNSFSGPLVYPGTQLVNYGLEIYFKHINAQGGVHGRKIVTQYYDDGYKPQNAVANTKRLVEQDKVFAILSPQGTAPVMATVKYLTGNKVPLLFPFQGVPIKGVKTIFTSFAPYPTQSEVVTSWLVEKKGFKRIGILYQDDKYGYTFRDPAKKVLEKYGLELIAAESYKRGTVDMSAQIAKLKKANLDALILVALPKSGASALKEAHKQGLKGTKIISSGPLTDEKFIILSGGVGEGVWGLSLWPDPVNSQRPAMAEYREMMKKYGKDKDNRPNRYSLFGYFYAKLFVEGLKKAGKNLTRDSYLAALEGMKNWENGIVPAVSFSGSAHLAQNAGFMVEVKKDVFKPISGWVRLKDGKLVEEPL
ncbi:MAG: ABC transporter substrate-binding protein [Desulfobacterales bacterium]|jgi:ABC-type branched-subunit amino acid transport system substrate-binding protein|nr:ABC transporter substrate-binding protein [Desulfobacterales bacterium]MDP6681835.1 ABC transporter substrate-binding protein [Desulfobacterales bacterium]MDP6808535.1 ABC transporter substrate-binding protein [Desulfobacterales bacterium]|tara:strand:- start:26715 stop:27920 length:1206 start_codon:yes stop_codon:yes gene_type:complete